MRLLGISSLELNDAKCEVVVLPDETLLNQTCFQGVRRPLSNVRVVADSQSERELLAVPLDQRAVEEAENRARFHSLTGFPDPRHTRSARISHRSRQSGWGDRSYSHMRLNA